MTERRRITLFDGMTLVAATAIGLSLAQFGWPRNSGTGTAWILTWPIAASSVPGYPSTSWMVPAADRLAPLLPCLAAWTGAYLSSRLHKPRPHRRRLTSQPGLIAAVVVLAVVAFESALLIASARVDGRFVSSSPSRVAEFAANGVVLLAHHAGLSVAACWIAMALMGRWRPEPGWVDRWGRVLGFTWILVGAMAGLLLDQTPWWGNFLGR